MENIETKPVPAAALPLSTTRRVGDLLFLSGRLALENGLIVGTTVGEQTDFILRQVDAILAEAGLPLVAIVKVTAWLTAAGDFAAYNEAYARWFRPPYPVRSTVVSGLLVPGALIEIECVASFPK